MHNNTEDQAKSHSVYCLCIDMIGSTEAGLKFPTRQFDLFNRELVRQIKPHLERLGLVDVPLKFTGDGWLLMTDEEDKVPALCCLTTIMASRFQDEMAERTSIARDKIPPLRLAMCSGRDIRVVLPDGRREWVGDSARKAVRASGYCRANERVIDDHVRSCVMRDFHCEAVDLKQRAPEYQGKRIEEVFPLYFLGELKAETVSDSEVPEYFVYTLQVIGEREAAETVIEQTSNRLVGEVSTVRAPHREEVLADILRRLNRLVVSVSDYSIALDIMAKMKAVGIGPDVFTYNIMINQAPNYETAEKWLEEMREVGIEPNIVTYNTLISQAPNYGTAEKWLGVMHGVGIEPNIVTYTALIRRSPNYETVEKWLEAMREVGIEPSIVTYNTLINKAPNYETVENWLGVMREVGIEPNIMTYNALIRKSPDYEIAKKWLREMRKASIESSLVTYNTLIDKAPDYDIAEKCFRKMCKTGIEPDVWTYSTLINKAPDYDTAKKWLGKMRDARIKPDIVTYNTLFSKDLSGISADEILKWYLAQEEHPEEPMQTAISSYRKIGRIDQALRLVLEYPHLEYPHLASARKVIRKQTEKDLYYFRDVAGREPDNPRPEFALGVALAELGKIEEAKLHLKQALKLASAPNMKALVEKWLQDLNARSSGKGA